MAQPPVQDSEWTQAPHIEWVHYIILFIDYRYATLHYPILLRIIHQVGVLKELLYHYHSLTLTLTFLIHAPSTLT